MAISRAIRTVSLMALVALALAASPALPAVAASATATASVTIEPMASVGPRSAFRFEAGAVSGTLQLEAAGGYSLTLPEAVTLHGADREVRVPLLARETSAPGGVTVRLQMPVTSASGENLTGRLPVLVELH